MSGIMALANSDGHNDRVAARNTTMPLRERIKRLTGKGINVCWKSLPEVKSSGLLGEFRDWHFFRANNWKKISAFYLIIDYILFICLYIIE